MQMDISAWIPYNPDIVLENTTKKFFGKYLYKLVVYCPAGRIIDGKKTIDDEFAHRQMVANSMTHVWSSLRNRDLDKADLDFLNRMRTLRQSTFPGIKMRVEEPRVQIYAETETQLRNIVTSYFQRSDYKYIEAITGPEDSDAEAILNSGAIIRKTDLGYTHKVILRDGRYGADLKKNVLDYLGGLGPNVIKLPKSGIEMLCKPSGYIWNLYFYTNDPGIATFINLINPGLVLNIHELVVASNK